MSLTSLHRAYVRVAPTFQRTFGVRLKSYFDPYIGFDVIRFDDEVVRSGDRRMSDVVREKWGDKAVRMIEELIDG